MPAKQATSVEQCCEMLRLAEEGNTYAAIADQVGVSFWAARKWIRKGKRCGKENLASCYGRPATGALADYEHRSGGGPAVRRICGVIWAAHGWLAPRIPVSSHILRPGLEQAPAGGR